MITEVIFLDMLKTRFNQNLKSGHMEDFFRKQFPLQPGYLLKTQTCSFLQNPNFLRLRNTNSAREQGGAWRNNHCAVMFAVSCYSCSFTAIRKEHEENSTIKLIKYTKSIKICTAFQSGIIPPLLERRVNLHIQKLFKIRVT